MSASPATPTTRFPTRSTLCGRCASQRRLRRHTLSCASCVCWLCNERTPSMTEQSLAKKRLLDAKPYIEHHPIFGYGYIPGTKLELPRPGGGRYHLQVNSQGIRSTREYTFRKAKQIRRIIVCGDSMAAGQFISNAHRFSELLE